jgi:hypothetical protein
VLLSKCSGFGEDAEDLAAASTLGIDFDPDVAWNEQGANMRIAS